MNHFQKIASFLLVFLLIVCLFSCSTEPAVDLAELKSEFKNPPSSSKPYTWWHWISGFITKEGITKDLEWMDEFGLGGAVVFNVGRLPDDIPRPVPFQTDEWWEMVDHAIREADRLGLKLGFHNCDGWSHSGGPWMEPHESMKKMVWSEVFVKPGDQNIVIPQPETIRDYYEDVAIMALPVKESSSSILVKRLSSNLSPFTSSFLLDGRNETFIDLNGHTPSDPVIFDFQFEKARDISSLSLGTNAGRMIGFHLAFEVSDDGKNYRTIKEFKSQSKGHPGNGQCGNYCPG